MNKVFIIIIGFILIKPPIITGSNFYLKVGYNGYSNSGLVKTIYPIQSNRPEWAKTSIATLIIPDVLETQFFINKKYAFQLDFGMLQPIWMLRHYTSLRMGIQKELNLPVISQAAVGYSRFLRVKQGKMIDLRLKGYYRTIDRISIAPELQIGIRVDERNNTGTMQIFDYVRLPFSFLFNNKDNPIGISLGTLMAFTTGSNGKNGFGIAPDFYLSFNYDFSR